MPVRGSRDDTVLWVVIVMASMTVLLSVIWFARSAMVESEYFRITIGGNP